MQKITTAAELKTAIHQLENAQTSEWIIFRKQLLGTFESLQPANLFKATLNQLEAMPELKEKILNTAVSLAAGYLSKKVLLGGTHGPIIKLLGTFLEMGIAIFVSKNTEDIKSGVKKIINTFSRKAKKAASSSDVE